MKNDRKKESAETLQQNFFTEKSSFDKFEEKLKLSIFGVLNVLLKFQETNFYVEITLLLTELLQFLYYPFNQKLAYIWKKPVFQSISTFLGYFQTVVIFQDNLPLYIVFFYLLIFLVVLTIIDIIYVYYSFSRNQFKHVWPLRILRSVVSFIVTVLFMPIVEFFIAILECSNIDDDGKILDYYYNLNLSELNCWEGEHVIHSIFAVLTVIIFCIICFIVQLIFYETKTSARSEGAKSNSKADVFLLIVKMACIIMYSFVVNYPDLHWVVVVFTFLLAHAMFYIYWTERPLYDERMMKAYLIYTGLFAWCTQVLLLGKILVTEEFDGCVELFFIGLPIICGYILTMKDNRVNILLTNISKFEKGESVIEQIRFFLEIVDKKNSDRKSHVLLNGYITLHEEYCTDKECPLKSYIKEIDAMEKEEAGSFNNSEEQKNIHSTVFLGGTQVNSVKFKLDKVDPVWYLYQHAQILFQNGISKFPRCTALRLNFAFFLMEKMNNTRRSLIELKNAEKYEPTFEEQFIVYRFLAKQKDSGSEEIEDEEDMDIVSNIAYKNHYDMFKLGMSNVTQIYIEFWGLLHNHNQNSDEDLTKLSEYGEKINNIVEEITTNFQKMQNIKFDDEEVLSLYAEFLMEILNDKEKANFYFTRMKEIGGDKLLIEGRNNNIIKEIENQTNDELQFIVISADGDNIGTILKISLSLCNLFGYTKQELIGKPIEVLIPELLREEHHKILQAKITKYKSGLLVNQIKSKKIPKISFKELNVFAINRSNHLVPVSIKVSLIFSQENSEFRLIGKVTQNEVYNQKYVSPIPAHIPPVVNYHSKVCYVLVNTNFTVKNFTVNALKILGFKSNTCGNLDITKMIRDNSDYHISINDNENIPKYDRFKRKYVVPQKIKWLTEIERTSNDVDKSSMKSKGLIQYSTKYLISINDKRNTNDSQTPTHKRFGLKRQQFLEESFFLSIIEVKMGDFSIGLVFRFEICENEDERDRGSNTNLFYTVKGGSLIHKPSDDAMIKSNYIPEDNVNFHIDPTTHNWLRKNTSGNEIKAKIKQEAMKIQQRYLSENTKQETLQTELIEEEEESDSGSYEDEDMECSESYSEEDSSEMKKTSERRLGVMHRKESLTYDDYYKVKMEKIKFLIYDFKSHNLLEIPERKRQSQVEHKKKEDYSKLPSQSLGDAKTEKKQMKNEEGDDLITLLEDNEEINFEAVLAKQIEYSLRKQETQPELLKLQWVSFTLFIVLILVTIAFFILFLSFQDQIREEFFIAINSFKLMFNIITGTFYTREIVLVNHPGYIVDPLLTRVNISRTMFTLYNTSYDLQSDIAETPLILSNGRKHLFSHQKILVETLDPESIRTSVSEVSLHAGISSALTSIYNLCHDETIIVDSNDKNVYYYMKNTFFPILNYLFHNAQVYLEDAELKMEDFSNIFNLILAVYIIVATIFFILMILSYNGIVKLKASYLEVFFQIDNEVIDKALNKCEKFAILMKNDDSIQITEDTLNNEIINEDFIKEEKKKPRFRSDQKSSRDQSQNKNLGRSEKRQVALVMLVLFLILFSFFLLIDLFYRDFLQSYVNHMKFYNSTAYWNSHYSLKYNKLREFFFNSNFTINGVNIQKDIESELNNTYIMQINSQSKEREILLTLSEDFTDSFNQIMTNSSCDDSNDLFQRLGISCEKFQYNTTSYGLEIVIANFMEEIREAKFSFQTEYMGKGNSFDIFNTPQVKNLNIFYIYLIKPIYEKILMNLEDTTRELITQITHIYIICFILFMMLITTYYIFYWKRFELRLGKMIYKTKNLLGIIPKEVLSSIPNIHKLLNLGNNYARNINKK